MKNSITDLNNILKKGILETELDFERASILDRKLRVLLKTNPELTPKRKQLRAILLDYEKRIWVEAEITDDKVLESDLAEVTAEQERVFLHTRKELIRQRLKMFSLSQKDLGKILGHTSVSYISELVNGINPFTMHDLIIIHLILKIDFEHLIPTLLTIEERTKLAQTVKELGNPKLKLHEQSLELISL